MSHFHDYFGLDLITAGATAAAFGGMNLFAGSLGAMFSDWCNQKLQMQGRLWAQFIALFGQAIFLFGLGCVSRDMDWHLAFLIIVLLSVFVNMAKGTSYSIVPHMIPEESAAVSAIVGAGGTLGAIITTRLCYVAVDDALLPFQLHAGYVMFWACTCFCMKWDHLGSMYGNVW